ncbi:hypothetical protein NUSPORA_00825 [Nucleospora cyclopteri]
MKEKRKIILVVKKIFTKEISKIKVKGNKMQLNYSNKKYELPIESPLQSYIKIIENDNFEIINEEVEFKKS